MKKNILFLSFLALCLYLGVSSCANKNSSTDNTSTDLPAASDDAALAIFKPVPLPNPKIPGFKFPEDSNLVNSWVAKNDMVKMAQHSWGIWTALTMNSGESYQGQKLSVFETWFTPQDIQDGLASEEATTTLLAGKAARNPNKLKKPRQFNHNGKKLLAFNQSCAVENDVLVTVKYDPNAAQHIVKNKLFDSTAMNAMLAKGNIMVPTFPNNSISIKPTYKLITKNSLVKGLYEMKIWTGPKTDTAGFPQCSWPAHIYVDINNKGKGDGSVALAGQGPTPQNTYNVSDFINIKVDSAMATLLKEEGFSKNVQRGDYVILVAMHITSKEIRRWVWESVWWSPNPNKPDAPSTPTIVANRPSQLQGAARHYAMTMAYTFINPDQPYTGGKNIGTPLFAFNPYLEAGFDAATFADAMGRKSEVVTKRGIIQTDMGVRTNCMSCHGQSNYNPKNLATGLGYIGDRYIDMADPRFKGTLQLDFLWSLDSPK